MTRRGPKSAIRPGHHETHQGAAITPDAVEFGRAMERYKRMENRPYPDCADILRVLKSLGYRKVVANEH